MPELLEEKANRLIQLRNLAKLSRKDMAQIAEVSFSTYKGWENSRFGGIPTKRAELLVNALNLEGINSSVDWLMLGIGTPPRKILTHQNDNIRNILSLSKNLPQEQLEELRIKAELEFFCNNNNWNTLSTTVDDNSMGPIFSSGDLVAGVKLPPEQFAQAIGLNCIVRTKNNKIFLRQIQKGSSSDLFTLLSLNNQCISIMYDIKLVDIAPVSWIRRKSQLS